MGIFEKPTIIIFLGLPGSGKSHFARSISDRYGLVRLNSDAMRTSIFGSREKTTEIYHSGDRYILNSYVFNAIDYATEELLAKGQSVIQDANHNQRSNRKNLEELAARYNGAVVLLHIKTPEDIAMQRAQERVETKDQHRHTLEQIQDVFTRMKQNIDLPEQSEFVIEIDGMASTKDQLLSFEQQMEAINVSAR
jgi:predicted kinase